MVAALIVAAYVLWLGLGLCLPPYIAGRYPATLLGRVYNERSCMFGSESWEWRRTFHSRCPGDCGGFSCRWMFAAAAIFPPAVLGYAAFGTVALICLGIYHTCKLIGSVPKKAELVGEKHRTQKLLPKASVKDE